MQKSFNKSSRAGIKLRRAPSAHFASGANESAAELVRRYACKGTWVMTDSCNTVFTDMLRALAEAGVVIVDPCDLPSTDN
jgi:hypothetical protein